MRRSRLKLLLSGLSVVALMAVTTSAFAVGSGDPVNDVIDPVTGIHPAQPAGYHTSNAGQADILGFDLSRSTAPDGSPALKATWNLNGDLPPAGVLGTPPVTNPYPSFNGWTFYVTFANEQILNNSVHIQCERTTSTDVKKTYVYQAPVAHYLDDWRFFIGYKLTYTGGMYKETPMMGYYDPSPDGAYFFQDVSTMPLMANKFRIERSGRTVSVTIAGTVQSYNRNCKGSDPVTGGILSTYYARPGDNIRHAEADSWLNQTVVLPVKVPLSVVPGEDDIEALGGFIYKADWAPNEGYATVNQGCPATGCVGPDQMGPSLAPGPTCWTPTFGGTAPSNPLHRPGQQCGIDNPVGAEYLLTNLDFVM